MAFDLVDLFFEFGLDFVAFRFPLGLVQLTAEVSDSIYALLQLVDVALYVSRILEASYVL